MIVLLHCRDQVLISTPEIFNSELDSQFTSRAVTAVLDDAGVRISKDGRCRAYDNIFIEGFWRTVKYKEVYLHDYQTVAEAVYGLRRYFNFYNNLRRISHWTTAHRRRCTGSRGWTPQGVRRTARLPLRSPYGLPPWQPPEWPAVSNTTPAIHGSQ